MRRRPSRRERLARWGALLAVAAALLAINLPTVTDAALKVINDYKINSQSYKEKDGHWSILPVPGKFRINAVHAALLYTGKVLIIAGSGNNRGAFAAGTFKSIVWNPENDHFKMIHTPSDMFCGGHAFLPDGKLLIAGGTSRYEVLESEVTRASGIVQFQDQSPGGAPIHLPAGSEITSPTGVAYRTTQAVTIKPGGVNEAWVEALEKGKGPVVTTATHFAIAGIRGQDAGNVFAVADSITLEKQNFWGTKKSYLFNPATESYEEVSDLQLARWYPSLVTLSDGRVLAVSGLDQFGRINNGNPEIYTPATRKWTLLPQLHRVLPTYPSLFLMPDGNLFYSGSNAGYGSAKIGRTPGIWNLHDNHFQVVPGLQDPNETETSGSVLLPPAQKQRYMIIGGGGVGQSPKSTSRIDIADLDAAHPHFEPGPSLAQPTRYPEAVITPDGNVIISGGSRGYRGEHESDILECHVYETSTGKLRSLADPEVGRDYHAEALLLPDGRIVTLGGNSLYGNKADTVTGTFEKRIEIYSPPYLYHGTRPKISGGPRQISRGGTFEFKTPDSRQVSAAMLIRPSAYTHVTNSEQRLIALDLVTHPGSFRVAIPSSPGLVPSGWYMLFVHNAEATPSEAYWVHVS